MKMIKFLSVMIAAIPSPQVTIQREIIDITGKEYVSLVGSDSSRIDIRTDGSEQIIAASYLNEDSKLYARFVKGVISGMAIQKSEGNVKTIILDNNGDGLPEVRQTIRVMPDGTERIVLVEKLEWKAMQADKK